MRTTIDALRSLKKYMSMVLGDDWEVRMAREEGTFRRPYAKVGLAGGTVYAVGAPSFITDLIQPFALSLFPLAGETPDEALLNALAVEELLYQGFRVGKGPLSPPTDLEGGPVAAGVFTAGDVRHVVTAVDRYGVHTPASLDSIVTVADGEAVHLVWGASGGTETYGVWRGDVGAERLIAYTTVTSVTDTGSGAGSTSAVLPTENLTTVGAPMRVPLWDYDGIALTDVATERFARDFMRISDLSVARGVDSNTDREFEVTADIRLRWRRAAEKPPVSGGPVQTAQVVQFLS